MLLPVLLAVPLDLMAARRVEVLLVAVFPAVVFDGVILDDEAVAVRRLVVFFLLAVAPLASHDMAHRAKPRRIAFWTKSYFT